MTPLTEAPKTGVPNFNIPTSMATALTTPYGTAPGIMAINHTISAINHTISVIQVRYSGSDSNYTYLYPLTEKIDIGDFVVVRARKILTLAKVTAIGNGDLLDPNATFKYLSVIDRVDLSREGK